MLISLLELCQEGVVKNGGTWMTLRVPDQRLGGLDVMDDHILAPGRYHESFVLISLLEVCQEGGVKKEETWRTLIVPEQRQGHP